MVFAFGSPEGLRRTVTMGVVSSIARQPIRIVLSSTSNDTPINRNRGSAGGCRRRPVDQHVHPFHLGGIRDWVRHSDGLLASPYPQLLK